MPDTMRRHGKLALLDTHWAELHTQSAIAEDTIWARGYQSITRPTNTNQEPRQHLTRLGIPTWATSEDRYFPGLLIPLYRATGERISWIFKPRVPVTNRDGKKMKYASARGLSSVVDVHPANRDRIADPTVPLWLTEGVKKADALASHGLCVAALSGVYNWRSTHGTLGDWEDIPLRGRTVVVCFDADARDKPDVLRAMLRLGNWLHSKGATARYLITPAEWAATPTKGADDYLAAGGTLDGLNAAITTAAPRPDGDTTGTFTDARLADTVADEVFDGGYCWAGSLGWLQWTGGRWRDCTDQTVGEAVRRYSLDRFTQAVLAADRDPTVIDGWRTMLGAGRERSVTSLAKGIVEKRGDEFDTQHDLLNTPTGVVDLETSELMPHDPDLLMRKQTAVGYIPGATHPDWETTLTCIPDDVRDYLQIRLGQAITGYPPSDDVLLILQGGGENGKSTLANTIRKALGKYFVLVSERALMANPDAHPTELMDFQGARYAVLEETPEARKLDTQRLKKTVGTPAIKARLMKKDTVEFEATHTLIINTNHRPIVDETDHGTWRRLMLISFPYRYRKPHQRLEGPNDRHGDEGLRDRCATNPEVWAACLAWLIDGARKWYEGGRVMPQPPARVVADTRSWRGESDLILAYVSDRISLDPASHVTSADLLADFNRWLKDRGHPAWSDRTFVTRFGSHDELGRSVTRKKSRAKSGLSRPPLAWDSSEFRNEPGSSYQAWFGVKFGAPPPDEDEPAEPIYRKAVISENTSSVPDVPASSVYPAEPYVRGVNRSSWNIWNTTRETSTVPDVPESQEALPIDDGWPESRNDGNCPACRMPRGSRVHRLKCSRGDDTQ